MNRFVITRLDRTLREADVLIEHRTFATRDDRQARAGDLGHWCELLRFGNRVVKKDIIKAMALVCRENGDCQYLEFLDPECVSTG
jgi:hypothetical protein